MKKFDSPVTPGKYVSRHKVPLPTAIQAKVGLVTAPHSSMVRVVLPSCIGSSTDSKAAVGGDGRVRKGGLNWVPWQQAWIR